MDPASKPLSSWVVVRWPLQLRSSLAGTRQPGPFLALRDRLRCCARNSDVRQRAGQPCSPYAGSAENRRQVEETIEAEQRAERTASPSVGTCGERTCHACGTGAVEQKMASGVAVQLIKLEHVNSFLLKVYHGGLQRSADFAREMRVAFSTVSQSNLLWVSSSSWDGCCSKLSLSASSIQRFKLSVAFNFRKFHGKPQPSKLAIDSQQSHCQFLPHFHLIFWMVYKTFFHLGDVHKAFRGYQKLPHTHTCSETSYRITDVECIARAKTLQLNLTGNGEWLEVRNSVEEFFLRPC